MALTNQEILFASLVSNGVVREAIPDLSLIQNELGKHVLPVLPLFPVNNDLPVVQNVNNSQFDNLWQADGPTLQEDQFFPLSFSIDEGATWFLLPYETLINITGKNDIVRRKVAKWKAADNVVRTGTIKERWNQDDYQIDITGVLIGAIERGTVDECFPREYFEKLRQVLTHPKHVLVQSPPLQHLGINRIVIEDFGFPFTKGENVQAYTIKAYSDFSYNLILT